MPGNNTGSENLILFTDSFFALLSDEIPIPTTFARTPTFAVCPLSSDVANIRSNSMFVILHLSFATSIVSFSENPLVILVIGFTVNLYLEAPPFNSVTASAI